MKTRSTLWARSCVGLSWWPGLNHDINVYTSQLVYSNRCFDFKFTVSNKYDRGKSDAVSLNRALWSYIKKLKTTFRTFYLVRTTHVKEEAGPGHCTLVSHSCLTKQEGTERVSVIIYLLETLLATGNGDNFARNLLCSLRSISYHGSEYVKVHEKETGSWFQSALHPPLHCLHACTSGAMARSYCNLHGMRQEHKMI